MNSTSEQLRPLSLSELFIKSDEYTSHKDHHGAGGRYSVELSLPISRKAAGDPIDIQSVQTAPGVQPVGIPLGLIDFIPEVRVTASSLMVPVQTAMGSEVAPVASGVAKPAVTDTYASSVMPVETIAGWIRVSTHALDDADVAGYLIGNPLLRAVRRQEEFQIVQGTGVSPQLRGVLSASAAIPSAASLPAAISAVGAAGYSPNGVLMNPADVEKVRVNAQTAGAVAYDPNRGVVIYYGLPVLTSIAVPVGTGIVGDWLGASVIFRRWDARVVVGTVNDDLTKNLVTMVGESRLAFAVTHSAAFAKFTIT